MLWALAWIDRVNVGFVKLTMLDELTWSETAYGLGAGIFFLGYFFFFFFFEVPSCLLLQRIGARRTIPRGLICVAMMFVTTPTMFHAVRFLRGVFEAGFYPGIILFLTYGYSSDRRAKAFGLSMSASGIAGVVGGPLAGTVMNGMHGVNGLVRLAMGVPDRRHPVGDRRSRDLVLPDRSAPRGAPAHASAAPARRGRPEARSVIARPARGGPARVAEGRAAVAADPGVLLRHRGQFGADLLRPWVVKEVGFSNPATIGWIMSLSSVCGAAGMVINGLHSDHSEESRLDCASAAALGAIGLVLTALFIRTRPTLALVAQTLRHRLANDTAHERDAALPQIAEITRRRRAKLLTVD